MISLKLDDGTDAQFDAEEGQSPAECDSGTYRVHGHTISFTSSANGTRIDYTLARTGDGIRLHVNKFFSGNATDNRIATVIWTAAPFHRG